jgi:hypothetical protein
MPGMGWGGAGSQSQGAAGGYQPTAAQGYASYGQQPMAGAASQTQAQAAGAYGQPAQGCVQRRCGVGGVSLGSLPVDVLIGYEPCARSSCLVTAALLLAHRYASAAGMAQYNWAMPVGGQATAQYPTAQCVEV